MTNHSVRSIFPILFLLLVAAGCKGGSSPDGDNAFQAELISISPEHDAVAFVPHLEGELRLLHASPIGELVNLQPNQAISVTFSRPMAALGTDIPTPDSLFAIEPPLEGQWRWNGTQSLVFQPAIPLPRATQYSVSMTAGIESIDGEQIDEPFSWTFETPRPRVIGMEPAMQSQDASPDQAIRLSFNQPLSSSLSASYFRINHQQEDATLNFTYSLESDSVVVLTPNQSMPKEGNIQVLVSSGVPAAEGPLNSNEQQFFYFSVHAAPALVNVSQPYDYYDTIYTNFDPGTGVSLNFATPVSFKDLREALTISPAVSLPAGIEARDDVISSTHRLPVLWEPRTQYTVSVDSLVDAYGQLLEHDEQSFATVDFSPALRVPTGLLVVEAEEQHMLPLRVTNIDQLGYHAKPLRADEIIPLLSAYDMEHYYNGDRAEAEATDSVMNLDVEPNKPAVLPLNLEPFLQNETGVVALRMRPIPDPNSDYPTDRRALVQVTRMGVTAKFSAYQNLFWVTSLSSANPIAGATVTLRGSDNKVYWEGVTDEDGKATGPGWHELGMTSEDEWSAPTQFVFAEKEGDLAFTSSLYNDGIEPYRMGVWYDWDADNAEKEQGLVFSDRGLYKAGETAHFKGIIRKKTDAEWMPITDSVRVLIESPREEIVHDEAYLPSDLGTIDFTWTSRTSADLGTYVIRVVHADDEEATTRESWEGGDITQDYFRVDAFRRATFSVDVQSMMPAYVAGDFYEANISGRYLFGAEMQNQPLRYYLYRRFSSFSPPGYEGFRFGAYNRSNHYNPMLASDETNLDVAGEHNIRLPIPAEPNGQPTMLQLTASVTDPARQESAGENQAIVHPALFYLGLKPSTTFLDLTETTSLSTDLVAVDPNGVPVDAGDVSVQLIRRQWNSVREVGSDGRLRWRSYQSNDVLQEQRLSIPAGQGQRLNLDVEQGGSYIIRAEGRDLRGNLTVTEAYFYATGAGYVAWERSDDDRIELQIDKDTYKPGETAHIMVQSPYEEATALITVEREGIISSRIETLRGSAPQVDIPLTDQHMPNVYVSVMLLTGRTAPPSGAADIGAPGFKVGYATLTVDPGERHLAVEIIPNQETYRPGDEVEVTLQLKDGEGNNVEGEIAFSAADAGVLNLIGYTLPDPFNYFYGQRPLGVSTSQTLANLVRQRNFGQKEEDEGGGGGGMDDAFGNVRKDFRPLAHWEPAIRTNGSGRATVRFTLPESLTTFRLMATALTSGHHYGNGQTDIIVTKPLVLKPALPRFARLDDRFEAGVLVTNTTGQDGTATVQVQADGLTLNGASEKQVDLPNGATREVRFDWMADQTGAAELQFGASLASERDAFVVGLPIQVPEIKETVAVFASTESSAAQELQLPSNIIPDLGSFEARVSSTALVGLEGAANYLFEYPYGCLEQRTSRIRPLIAGEALLETFDLTVLDHPPATLIEEWLGLLNDYWLGDGFSLWPGSRYRSMYVSAYVVLALAEVQEAGYTIPAELTQQAVDALALHVRQSSSRPSYYNLATWNDTKALMLYALARHGAAPAQELDAALSQAVGSQTALSSAGRSHLLRAVTLAGEPLKSRYQQTLIDDLLQRFRIEGTTAYLTASQDPNAGWIFASDTRATAFGLTALLEADPPADFQQFAEQMVRYLIDQRQSGRWATTQENAAVVEALYRFTQRYEEASPNFTATVQVAGRQILQSTFQGRSLDDQVQQVPLADLPQAAGAMPVTINKDGDGRAYYSLMLQAYPSGPVSAREQGLRVTRSMQLLDDSGERVGSEMATGGTTLELEAGQLVRVVIRLTSPSDRNYVVVDDALPAGLEAVNDAFITTDSQVTEDTGSGQWWGSFNYTQMRDDRVLLFADYLRRGDHTYTYVARATTPGTYVHPPAQSELMYRPEINGRNASGTLIVVVPTGETAER